MVGFARSAAGEARGLFCGMGVCFDCLVTVDGADNQRACMTRARPGCRVELAHGLPPSWAGDDDAD
jgi:hypothetical protein